LVKQTLPKHKTAPASLKFQSPLFHAKLDAQKNSMKNVYHASREITVSSSAYHSPHDCIGRTEPNHERHRQKSTSWRE